MKRKASDSQRTTRESTTTAAKEEKQVPRATNDADEIAAIRQKEVRWV